MAHKSLQKLELTWIGKGNEPKLEPRILIENPEYSYGSNSENSANPVNSDSDNMLIHGDNLLALKALEQDFAGKVKCIYIDPPYNTGNAFEHYDDGVEHSLWLNLISQRIKILHKLLSKDGVLFVNIDETEHAYLKVLLDEIFGRKNFIGDIIWKKRKGGGNDSRFFAIDHDYIIVFAKEATKEIHRKKWRVSQSEEYLKRYKEIDENGDRYYWDTLARDGLQNPIPITVDCPDGTTLSINSQKSYDTIYKGLEDGNIRLAKSKNGWNLHHRVYMPEGQVLRTIMDDVGTNKTANDETIALFGTNNGFDYPKPESLIQKLLELVTEKGDLVLDSFLGSGTTAAVAHKMGRRWIGIELGEHAKTHCFPRLKAVVDGEQGGISKAVNWQGGGGFKFYTLAPPLLSVDKFGNKVINENYDAQMLAAAMAKHEGFLFQPDGQKFWKQGRSSEQDYIFTTTHYLTREFLDAIAEDLLAEESLLVCCTQYESGLENAYPNINIRRIPGILLNRCEFKQDSDYSLNIINSPLDELRPETGERIKPEAAKTKAKEKPNHTTEMPDLFSQTTNE